MKIKFYAVLLLLFSQLHAFENGQLSLDSVSSFEANDAGFSIRHRMYGDITDYASFFGVDDGANTLLSLRYAFSKNIIAEVHHTRDKREYNARVGYAYHSYYLDAQVNLNLFSFEESGIEERRNNLFINYIFQSPLLFEHLRLTSNIGYDNYYEKVGAGLGVELESNNFFPSLTFTEKLSLIGEIYTKYAGLGVRDTKFNAYAFGIKFRTYAHHFEILATNSTATDARVMMQGSDDSIFHFAFNINRKF